ncbi:MULTISPECIES: hypothetical protein [unclassified Caballeronia]
MTFQDDMHLYFGAIHLQKPQAVRRVDALTFERRVSSNLALLRAMQVT